MTPQTLNSGVKTSPKQTSVEFTKIEQFHKGQELLYHCPDTTHYGVVNFIDDVHGSYITLTVGESNLVIYPTWWDRLEECGK